MRRGPRILVRTVGSGMVGGGHVARCGSVGLELARAGADVRWACDCTTRSFLASRSIEMERVCVLTAAGTEGRFGESELPPERQIADAEHMLRETSSLEPFDLVLVDTYLLGAVWQRSIRARVPRLATFDDLLDRPIQTDIVINAAAEAGEYRSVAPGAHALCGLQYAVAAGIPRHAPTFDGSEDLLVAFGASDAHNMTSRVLVELAALRNSRFCCRVLIQLGAAAPHRATVETLARGLGWAHILAPDEPVDASRLHISLAVGASGVSLYERMRDGIPSVVLPLASNQRRIARVVARCGAAVVCDTPSIAASVAASLLGRVEDLRDMSGRAMRAVDGLGARRIADSILTCCS